MDSNFNMPYVQATDNQDDPIKQTVPTTSTRSEFTATACSHSTSYSAEGKRTMGGEGRTITLTSVDKLNSKNDEEEEAIVSVELSSKLDALHSASRMRLRLLRAELLAIVSRERGLSAEIERLIYGSIQSAENELTQNFYLQKRVVRAIRHRCKQHDANKAKHNSNINTDNVNQEPRERSSTNSSSSHQMNETEQFNNSKLLGRMSGMTTTSSFMVSHPQYNIIILRPVKHTI